MIYSKVRSLLTQVAVLATAFTLPAAAHAALGGDTASVNSDGAALRSTVRVTAARAYTRHALTAAGGGQVHEYVNSAGKVFAVTWQGAAPLKVSQLLGSYAARYQAAATASAKRVGMHRMLTIQDGDFVLQSVVRQRSAGGRAYLPAQLPTDVTLSDLQ